jgi:pimeloyl-ACP methyl ester carboxylesterase
LDPWLRAGAGEPLVLIHGFAASWRAWLPVVPLLQQDHEVLAVGIAGHIGRPPPAPNERLGVQYLVDELERDMDEAGFADAHVVGNSLGGWMALELAKRGRARSVVAIAPAGGWADDRFGRQLARRFLAAHYLSRMIISRAEGLVRRQRIRHLLVRAAVAHPHRLDPIEVVHGLEAFVACSIYRPLLRSLSQDGGAADLHLVTCPVRLAWPTLDRILPYPSAVARFTEQIPNLEVVELAGLGHVPMSDDPELVARIILEFTRPTVP